MSHIIETGSPIKQTGVEAIIKERMVVTTATVKLDFTCVAGKPLRSDLECHWSFVEPGPVRESLTTS